MKIAVTVDELLLWDGTPMPPGYTATTVVDGMLGTFREHGIEGVYGFAHTSPVADRRRNARCSSGGATAGITSATTRTATHA